MSGAATFVIAFSAVFGTAEAIRNTQAQARRKEHRSRKNQLVIHCLKSTAYSPAIEGKHIVLSGEKAYVDTGTSTELPFGHRFAGYFLPYPETQYSGLVSTICDDPPIMNWIYVDRETYEVKFGARPEAEPNYNGPFDCTRQDRRLTFGGWEGFCVVKEGAFWALYFDLDRDRLRSKLPEGTPVIEVELLRTEIRVLPPPPPPPKAETPEDGEAAKAVDQADQADQFAGCKEQAEPVPMTSPDVD